MRRSTLFRRFDRHLWEKAGRNPVRLLGMIDQRLLEAAAKGEWYRREHSEVDGLLVAYFPPGLMDYFFDDFRKRLGIGRKEFLGPGRRNPEDDSEDFCMTALALRLASYSNGVSRLHGSVSRQMWNDIWKGSPWMR
jgi:glucan phosphorylase